jgi:hypothetical protein
MLFGEAVAVYCENHIEHTDTLCGQNAEILKINECGTHSYHSKLDLYAKFGSNCISQSALEADISRTDKDIFCFRLKLESLLSNP